MKKNYYIKILLLITIIFLFLPASGESKNETIKIKIFRETLINDYFYGFGAETLPWLWTKENKEAGVDSQDIKINFERIYSMSLPITRIFVPWETWNSNLDYKTFNWQSDEMESLYRTLDFYENIGTKVILVTADWQKESPWKDAESSAKAVLELLEFLVKKKGYECIKFWTLTNEPELTYGWLNKLSFQDYVQIHQLVKKGLKERNLPIKIIASDDVESEEWFKNSVQSLYSIADIFSSHAYFYPQDTPFISNYLKTRLNIIKKAPFSKKETPFFLCEFGFRGADFGVRTNSLIRDYEYGLYTAIFCIEALNSGVSAASLWCLYEIRLIDEIYPEGGRMMRIGLWAYKDQDWKPFPIFYLYQLFTRYIKSGSRVLKTWVSHPAVLKAACVEYGGRYSLFIVNLTDKSKRFIVKYKYTSSNPKKYLYSKSEPLLLNGDLLEPQAFLKIKNYIEDQIPGHSVILYTDLEDEPLFK